MLDFRFLPIQEDLKPSIYFNGSFSLYRDNMISCRMFHLSDGMIANQFFHHFFDIGIGCR